MEPKLSINSIWRKHCILASHSRIDDTSTTVTYAEPCQHKTMQQNSIECLTFKHTWTETIFLLCTGEELATVVKVGEGQIFSVPGS